MKCRKEKELKVLESFSGYYIGTTEKGMPGCRCSDYFKDRLTAQEALDTNAFIERESVEIEYCNQMKGCILTDDDKNESMDDSSIDCFDGEYGFLSNFEPCKIAFGCFIFDHNEGLFQSGKATNLEKQMEFVTLTPGKAKRLGRRLTLPDNWENYKIDWMRECVEAKFAQNPELLEKLLETGNRQLIEGNTWNDKFWGVCNGEGENHLGLILMETREKFRNNPKYSKKCIFKGEIHKQMAVFVQAQLAQSKLTIFENAYEISFYENVSAFLLNGLFDEDDDFIEKTEKAFFKKRVTLASLREEFINNNNFSMDSNE